MRYRKFVTAASVTGGLLVAVVALLYLTPVFLAKREVRRRLGDADHELLARRPRRETLVSAGERGGGLAVRLPGLEIEFPRGFEQSEGFRDGLVDLAAFENGSLRVRLNTANRYFLLAETRKGVKEGGTRGGFQFFADALSATPDGLSEAWSVESIEMCGELLDLKDALLSGWSNPEVILVEREDMRGFVVGNLSERGLFVMMWIREGKGYLGFSLLVENRGSGSLGDVLRLLASLRVRVAAEGE